MPAFPGLTTERLTLRAMGPADADSLWRRRNDPTTAEFQSWSLPFPRERATAMCASFADVDGPRSDDWWMAAVCDRDTGDVIGDLALHLTFDARSAEIGYTIDRSVWGRGIATEAAAALTDWLVDEVGVSRVSGMTHPENLASVVVLERLGMRFEGHTRNSYWVGDDNTDDWLFGMTAEERRAWRSRDRSAPSEVELVEITHHNAREISRLVTHHSQRRFVTPVLESYGDALFPAPHRGHPVVPWMRGIAADGVLTGFLMMAERTEHHRLPYLWRLLVDRSHQRRGIGARALNAAIEHAREQDADGLEVSWVEGPGSPAPLYLQRGFVPTGEVEDGETVARLDLGAG